MIAHAGMIHAETGHWRSKNDHHLLPENNLAKLFRAKMPDGIKNPNLKSRRTRHE
jgi:hypothetical protein